MAMKSGPGWRNRIVGSGEESPDQLLANPGNWRIHPSKQQEALAGSLDVVGWVQQVMVNRRTGFVVDGHARVALAISRGEPMVPVLYVDLEPEEEALVLASLDPIAALAGTDDAQLAALLESIETDNEGLRALLSDLGAKPREGLTEPDDLPEPVAETYVKPGDLWVLGRHRVLCGDATSPADVARVLDGERPNITVTDPPYGVEYDASWRREVTPDSHLREGKVNNDDRADWSAAMELFPGEVAYVWHGGLHAGLVSDNLAATGFEVRAQIIWVKPSLVLSRGAYHWQHEPAWFAVRKGATASWIGDRKQTTVWEVAVVKRSTSGEDMVTEHSTQKPVECMARPLRNHEGDVYDPFLGSGTTLIAAEQAGRRCFGIEIDPRYVQMTIERWQNFTGGTAVRA